MTYLIVRQNGNGQQVVGMYANQEMALEIANKMNEVEAGTSKTDGRVTVMTYGCVPASYEATRSFYVVVGLNETADAWYNALVKKAWPR